MKDIYKNPTFYYILVPIVLAFWPLLLWGVYLPNAERSWNLEKTRYEKAQKIIAEILTLDPGRLEFADSKNAAADFDYAGAIERVASLCRISSSRYNLSSGIIITTSGQKSQSAKITLKQLDVAKFAGFLSTLQLRWANLQCTQVKLTKKKDSPDTWNVDLGFKYYY